METVHIFSGVFPLRKSAKTWLCAPGRTPWHREGKVSDRLEMVRDKITHVDVILQRYGTLRGVNFSKRLCGARR